jgi:hypothetical protein
LWDGFVSGIGQRPRRTASNVEGRTVSEADRRDTSTFSMPLRDSDVGIE